jgi:O-methyltransferase involved in polyketide biosynthesis
MRDLGGATFAVLDLPVMIKDRGNVLPPANESPYQILTLNYDILVDELADTLRRSGAPTDVPIFFIWEGCSMYFSRTESDAFLRQIKNLMSPASQLWFDFASSDAVGDLTEQYEVKAFMDSMRMIGEPFMRGFSDVKVELAGVGLHVKECKSAAQLLGGTDPVLDHYSFALCGSMGD